MSARFSLHHPLPAYLRPPLHFISPIAPPLKTLSQVLFFRGPRAHLYACSVAQRTYCDRGDTWVLKNARLYGAPTPTSNPKADPEPRPRYWHQSTKHYYFDPSQSKIVLCTSCFASILLEESMLLRWWAHPSRTYYPIPMPIFSRRTAFY